MPKTLPKTSKAAKSRTPRRPAARPASRPASRATAKAAPRPAAGKAGPRPVASRARSEKPAAKPAAKSVAKPAAAPARAATRRALPTGRDLEAMRESLRHKRDEMLGRYKRDLRVGQETSDDGTDDIVDRANNSYHRELMFSLSDTDRVQLLQIEAAMKRFENGGFGKCVHCGQPIALQRLLAIPWARLCIDCQELAEKGMLED